MGGPKVVESDNQDETVNRHGLQNGAGSKEKPAVSRRWLTLVVPIVSCFALMLSSWEIIREYRSSGRVRQSERIRAIQSDMVTLVELETEYRRALELSGQAMLPYGLNATMQILLEAASDDVDALLEHLNPSVLISFAYYNLYAGNYVTAERYYSEVLRRLKDAPEASTRAARHAASMGLGNVYLGDSPITDRSRARELFENMAEEYEREPDMINRGYLVELLGGWAFMEQSLGNSAAARTLRERARKAMAYLSPGDSRRVAYEEYLSGEGLFSPGDLLRVNGEWRVEFPDEPRKVGAATIRRQGVTGGGWHIHAEVFWDSRMVEQWGGNGFAAASDTVVFPVQGYGRQNLAVAPNPVLGSVQLQPAPSDEDVLEGTYNLLGTDRTSIRLRRGK